MKGRESTWLLAFIVVVRLADPCVMADQSEGLTHHCGPDHSRPISGLLCQMVKAVDFKMAAFVYI